MDKESARRSQSSGEHAVRQRSRVISLLRAILVILLVVVATLGMVTESNESPSGIQLVQFWWAVVLATLLFFAGVVTLDLLTPTRKLSTISAILVGALAGLLATVILSFVLDLFVQTYGISPNANRYALTAKVIIGLGLCYLGITTVLQTQDDFRLVIPYVEFTKQIRGVRPLLLDTSVLIDSRILDVGETGILQAPIIIPSFVVGELQLLADSGDKLKRTRGRRGLDVVSKLQRSAILDVSVDETPMPGKSVDSMLVEMARHLNACIITSDSGLERVAGIQGVAVLNLNALANALKTTVLPGETLEINLVRKGEQPGQGIGYLDDGAMVVAEEGAEHVGERVSVTVTSSLQTNNGRLIFARVESEAGGADNADLQRTAHDSADDPGVEATSEAPADTAGSDPADRPRKRPDRRRAAVRNPRRG